MWFILLKNQWEKKEKRKIFFVGSIKIHTHFIFHSNIITEKRGETTQDREKKRNPSARKKDTKFAILYSFDGGWVEGDK